MIKLKCLLNIPKSKDNTFQRSTCLLLLEWSYCSFKCFAVGRWFGGWTLAWRSEKIHECTKLSIDGAPALTFTHRQEPRQKVQQTSLNARVRFFEKATITRGRERTNKKMLRLAKRTGMKLSRAQLQHERPFMFNCRLEKICSF